MLNDDEYVVVIDENGFYKKILTIKFGGKKVIELDYGNFLLIRKKFIKC